MLDIGWSEMLIVGLITIIVVGPKELPRVLRTVTQLMRKLRAMASEFQSGIDDLAREAELQDIKQSIEKTASTDIAGEFEKAVDPTGDVNKSVREIEDSLNEDPREGGAAPSADPIGKAKTEPAKPSIAPPHSLGDSFGQTKKAKPATTKAKKTTKTTKAAPGKAPAKSPAKPKPKARQTSGAKK